MAFMHMRHPLYLHYVTILEHDWSSVKLRLTTSDNANQVDIQSTDPDVSYTGGKTGIFKCTRIISKNSRRKNGS